MYTLPPMETIIEMVKSHDKRVGLRMLYQEYDIPEQERHKYRKIWNMFYDLIPDAFEKELNNAVQNSESTKNYGDSEAQSFETLQEESWSPEDVEESA